MGGKAKVVGTLFGVMLIGVIGNTLNLVGVSPFWQWASKGLIIVLAIILDSVTESFFIEAATRLPDNLEKYMSIPKIGLIGCGMISEIYLKNAKERFGNLNVAYCADIAARKG